MIEQKLKVYDTHTPFKEVKRKSEYYVVVDFSLMLLEEKAILKGLFSKKGLKLFGSLLFNTPTYDVINVAMMSSHVVSNRIKNSYLFSVVKIGTEIN